MYCGLTGEPPKEPVVCRHSGLVYEKSLIEQYVEENGKCPASGEPMSLDDLIAIKSSKIVKPRPVAATSIPGMLQMFQNEWDACMLETYTLKQQLDTTRQELAHALYQVDAASRVIARLVKERDEARSALSHIRETGGSPMAVADETEFSSAVLDKIEKLRVKLSQGRKGRKCTRLPNETVAAFSEKASHAIHKASKPIINCVAVHPVHSEKVLTGGDDMTAVLFDRSSEKKLATLTGHSKKVSRVAFHPSQDVLFTASSDKTARVWTPTAGSYRTSQVLGNHSGIVTGLAVHPLGDYAVTASSDSTWQFHDIHSGLCLEKVAHDDVDGGYCCTQFHPDGLLLGTASGDGVVRIWDMNSRETPAASLNAGSPVEFSFSENGYYLVSLDSSTAKLWDLRRMSMVKEYSFAKSFKGKALSIDYSGTYTACAGSNVQVLTTKTLEVVSTLDDASKPVMGVAWTRDSSTLLSVSKDKHLREYA